MLDEPEGYETHEFLTPTVARKAKAVVVDSEPRYVDTKYGKKLFVDVKIGKDILTWVQNAKTTSFLLKQFGKNEKNWIGKKVNLEVVMMVVQGERKNVIFAKGSV